MWLQVLLMEYFQNNDKKITSKSKIIQIWIGVYIFDSKMLPWKSKIFVNRIIFINIDFMFVCLGFFFPLNHCDFSKEELNSCFLISKIKNHSMIKIWHLYLP